MRLIRGTIVVAVLSSFCGCEQSPPQPPRAFRVKGRLFVDDQLAAQANIAFCPIDKAKAQGRCSVAMTQRDGSFELTTYVAQDGAPEGDYRVTIFWPDETMPEDECECVDPLQHDRLGGNYADPETTSLLVTVLPRDNYVNLSAEGKKRSSIPGIGLQKGWAEGSQ